MAKDEDKRTSFAVLVRKRSQISIIESALRARNIPTEVIGVGGLIYIAEVADVLALMKVVTNPEAGTALMRHLSGPRLALGAKDIAALGAYSENVQKMSTKIRTHSSQRLLQEILTLPKLMTCLLVH